MIKNYVKIALRNLRRNASYAVLNVAGLALGLACCLLIAVWVQDERAFDRFHTNSERIYRLNKVNTLPTGGSELHALSSGPMGPTLMADIPEIETTVRLLPWWGEILMGRGDEMQPVPDVTFADADLFEVFDFTLVRGDEATALETPLSIVLTPSLAQTIFGNEDPLGQTLLGMGDLTYTVTGIVEDAPTHSHLQYSAFVSWSSLTPGNGALEMGWLDRWLPQTLFTYVMLRPGTEASVAEAKLPAFMQQHLPERAEQYDFYLQPLEEIYLGSTNVLYQRSMVQGNQTYIYILSVVALLILLIACVNFMNLATARASRRAVEVGVRKVIGAQRGQLVAQFLGEALLLVTLSLGTALILVEIVRTAFNTLVGKQLAAFVWAEPQMLLALLVVGLVFGLGAGLYPALVLSGFRPARVLKGSAMLGGQRFRQVLVTAQFAASIALLAGTSIVYQQMQYVQDVNPGFDRDQIVVLSPRSIESNQFDAFKTETLRHPSITHATSTSDVPGQDFSTYTVIPEGRPDDEGLTAAALFLYDTDLLDTYGMTLAAGRFFEPGRAVDSSGVVINEAMQRSLGWTDAVGKTFEIPGEVEGGTIIGVVQDFQVASLHQEIGPLFMALKQQPGSLSLRITGDDLPGTLAHLQTTWAQFETRYPFEYRFLDDDFVQLYQADRQLMQTLGLFAVLAILVACLGLFGLAAYTAEQRTKEIGVRKVLGASVGSVVALLSKDFARLVALGFVLAAPLAYLAANRWLESFAYRIEISWPIFLIAGLATLGVALLAVSYQAMKAAVADPVVSLRSE